MSDHNTSVEALQERMLPVLKELSEDAIVSLRVEPLQGDASTRVYSRLHVHTTSSEISYLVAQYPRESPADELGSAKIPSYQAFSEVGSWLAEHNVPVPRVLRVLDEGRTMVLQDLGDRTFFSALQDLSPLHRRKHYEQAVDLLAHMHKACWPVPRDHVIARRSFDRDLLRSELEHFRDWGLLELFADRLRGLSDILDNWFEKIVAEICAQPQGFVHRDYQSKNLIWDAQDKLHVIDFQDALTGPRIYDLVALLCDSYVNLDLDLQNAMIERYRVASGWENKNPHELQRDFWWVTLQRKLKDAGRFVYIDRVRKNPRFLQYYPQSLIYVGRALHALQMNSIAADFSAAIPGFPDGVAVPAAKS